MADSNMQLQWTDDQWNRVRQVVYEEARKARVAGNFLPLYGPMEPDATYVSKDELTIDPAPSDAYTEQTIYVNNQETLPLFTLQVEVFLRGAQVADPELTSALSAFRRAANVLARLEDTMIFTGKPSDENREKEQEDAADAGEKADRAEQLRAQAERLREQAERLRVQAAAKGAVAAIELKQAEQATEAARQSKKGTQASRQAEHERTRNEEERARRIVQIALQEEDQLRQQELEVRQHEDELRQQENERRQEEAALLAAQYEARNVIAAERLGRLPQIWTVTPSRAAVGLLNSARPLTAKSAISAGDSAGALVSDISNAISQLEAEGHLGPFASILGHSLFTLAQTPNNRSLVLPQDRILPFLGGGPLLRTSTLPNDIGLVVASGGAPIDLVVATDISVCFVQITLEPRFVFRVYEKIALRIKEKGAIVQIRKRD